MNRGTWKAAERRWAKDLNGLRVPVSGRQRGDQPDVQHERYSVEVKAGRVLSTRLQVALEQARAAARDGQVPLVAIEHSRLGRNGNLRCVLLELSDFLRLVEGRKA